MMYTFHPALHAASQHKRLYASRVALWQQIMILLCSATNYLMGLSSVPFKPFLAATFVAMAIWGPLYASIGAASRGVLQSRGDVGAIFSGMCTLSQYVRNLNAGGPTVLVIFSNAVSYCCPGLFKLKAFLALRKR